MTKTELRENQTVGAILLNMLIAAVSTAGCSATLLYSSVTQPRKVYPAGAFAVGSVTVSFALQCMAAGACAAG